MTLREKQSLFAECVASLITFAVSQGYQVTFGDAFDTDGDGGHMAGTVHNLRLAVDFNLFKAGAYLSKSEDHAPLGTFWKSLHPLCRWGGDFTRNGKPAPDGNHYSITHGGRA